MPGVIILLRYLCHSSPPQTTANYLSVGTDLESEAQIVLKQEHSKQSQFNYQHDKITVFAESALQFKLCELDQI